MMSSMKIKKDVNYLNVTQAAKFIGISRATFYDWLQKGFLPKPVFEVSTMSMYDKNDIMKIKRLWEAKKDAAFNINDWR